MDQVRAALGWLKKYHFWVLSVLVALLAVFFWRSAAATLTADFNTNKSTITGQFTNLKNVQGQPFHANTNINENQAKEIEKQAEHVEAIWKQLYERQSAGVLVWPEKLSKAFRDAVTKLKFGDDIPGNLLDNYRDYIELHFESLPKQVGARVMDPSEGGGEGGFNRGRMDERSFSRDGGEGGAVMPALPEEDYLCEWLDQPRVREELNFKVRPSALRVWVTQENLWVYHTLLEIIAKTNEAAHADRMSNAAIRTIYSLEVGRLAAAQSLGKGHVQLLASAAPPAGGEGEGERVAAPADGGDGGARGDGGEMTEMSLDDRGGEGGQQITPEMERAILLSRRYLDEKGMPLPVAGGAAPAGGDLAAAPPADGGGGSGGGMPSGPFKRLPVRMTLQMDQRWLSHLISECASQPLQVEVTEVRINPQGFGAGGEGGYSFGGRGGGDGGVGNALQIPTDPVLSFKQQPNMATVVVQGIIYIFNEPDKTILHPSGEAAPAAQP